MGVRIDFSGPFFEGDPAKTFRANIRDFMDVVVEKGEEDVRRQIEHNRDRMPHYTGHTAARVRGRTKNLAGRRWATTGVVSMDTREMSRTEAIRTQAAASSIEGRFHPFRRTTAAIKRGRKVAMERLLKGLT